MSTKTAMQAFDARIQEICDDMPQTIRQAEAEGDARGAKILLDAQASLVEARMKLCAGQDKPREGYRGRGYAMNLCPASTGRRGDVMRTQSKPCLTCARCGPTSKRGGRIAHTCPERQKRGMEINPLSRPMGNCYVSRRAARREMEVELL